MKITEYKSINRGSLLAGFDLETPSGMLISGMKLFNGKNGHFVGFPERSYDNGGETKYARIISIPNRERSDAFNSAVLDALRAAGHL